MEIVLIVTAGVIGLFAFVLLFGAPYLPTLHSRTDDVFDLLGLQPGDTMLELGSGDGKLLAAAAKKGIYAVGYELNPLLVIYTKLRYWRHRRYITVHLGNFWNKQWPPADGIYVFLLDRYMARLDSKLQEYAGRQASSKSLKLVSYTFKIPGKKPQKETGGMFLYTYD